MPYVYFDGEKYYWKEQLDFAYSQYCGLSKKNLQPWLNNKLRMRDSIIKYARKRESEEFRLISIWVPLYFVDDSIIKYVRRRRPSSYFEKYRYFYKLRLPKKSSPPPPPPPPLININSKEINNTFVNQLQLHIRRLENEPTNIHHEISDGLKRNKVVRYNDDNYIDQLNQNHENELNLGNKLYTSNNIYEFFDELKENKVNKTNKKKKDKKEFYSKYNWSHKKGKNIKNKFARNYG
jgi:hypothetical protein